MLSRTGLRDVSFHQGPNLRLESAALCPSNAHGGPLTCMRAHPHIQEWHFNLPKSSALLQSADLQAPVAWAQAAVELHRPPCPDHSKRCQSVMFAHPVLLPVLDLQAQLEETQAALASEREALGAARQRVGELDAQVQWY